MQVKSLKPVGSGFEGFFDAWRSELVDRTVRSAYARHRLMAPTKRRLGRLEFPYATSFHVPAKPPPLPSGSGARAALDRCYRW